MPPPSLPARRSWLYLKSVFSGRFTPAHYVRKSDLESYIICLTFSGAGRLEYEGKTYTLAGGEGFIVDCRLPFYCRAASPSGWGYHCVVFDGFPMGDYFSLIKHAGGLTFSLTPESSFYRTLDRLYETNRRVDRLAECVNSCFITNMLTEILMTLPSGGVEDAPERIMAIREYLEGHYTKNITIEALAGRFAMSRYHLSREFKKHTGVSPSEYLISLRLDHAKRLLRFTDMKISRIALEAGYPDAARLFALFRKRERMSPGEYRHGAAH
jgi:AraC-like DNA-binding protein